MFWVMACVKPVLLKLAAIGWAMVIAFALPQAVSSSDPGVLALQLLIDAGADVNTAVDFGSEPAARIPV